MKAPRYTPIQYLKYGALVALILVVMYYYFTAQEAPPYMPPICQRADAVGMAHQIMEQTLKSPSTADFCSTANAMVREEGGLFVVSSCVDSQNGFGAMIRTDFTITMKCDNDRWVMVDLKTSP